MAGVEWFLELLHSGLFCTFSTKVSPSRSGMIFRPHFLAAATSPVNSDASHASKNPMRMHEAKPVFDLTHPHCWLRLSVLTDEGCMAE